MSVLPVARALALADLDGDGRPEAVVGSGKASRVAVIRLAADRAAAPVLHETGVAPFAAAGADLDRDGAIDLAVANETNTGERPGEVTVLFGDGRGRFPRRATLPAGTYPADVAIADLDTDGLLDLAVLNWGSGDVSLLRAEGPGRFLPTVAVAHGGGPAYGLAVADLDDDGSPELAVVEVAGRVRILRREAGTTRFVPGSVLDTGAGARDVAVADLDGDGRRDLVTADTAADTVSILRGLGAGRFASRQALAVGRRPRRVTVADLDRDGRPDLAVTAGGAGTVTVLLAR